MSEPFDRLLCDPDEVTLLEALEQAARRCQLPPGEMDDLEKVLVQIELRPQGRTQAERWSTYAYVEHTFSVTWWSDHQGRKHVRVTADVPLHRSWADEDARPPLWHICPGRIYRVSRAAEVAAWLACCACGEVGVPDQLGWAGDCCGPCHDRREEGGPAREEEHPQILGQDSPINALAFSPTGDSLAVSSGRRRVVLHDLRRGGRQELSPERTDEDDPGPDDEIRPLHFSPDGGELVGVAQAASSLRVWRLSAPADPPASVLLRPVSWVTATAFSPSGDALACCDDVGNLHIHERAGWKHVYFGRRASAIDFAPDGSTLVVGSPGGVIRLLEAGSWPTREKFDTHARPHKAILFLKHTPDGDRLVLVNGTEDPYAFPRAWQVRLWSLSERRELLCADIPVVSNVEMTPDGRYLAWLVHDDQHSPAAVHYWDLQSWRSAGWLEWNPEDDLRDLAFSPDGQTMATGSASGVVKLWPWRRLLEGAPP